MKWGRGAIEMCREEPGDLGPVARVLVQPRVLAARDHEGLDRCCVGVAVARPPRSRCQSREVTDRDDIVAVAVDEQDRTRVARDGRRGGDVGDDVAARAQVDVRRQPRERIGDRIRDREPREAEGLASQAIWVGRR
jgi:hypothetical protein